MRAPTRSPPCAPLGEHLVPGSPRRAVVRAIQQAMSAAVAGAMIEFLNGALRQNPNRIGHALRNDLEGLWSARRDSFRVIYAIDDTSRIVSVVRVDHRRDVYR